MTFTTTNIRKSMGTIYQLLFTDTDNLFEDVYKDMAKHVDLYDTSDCHKGNPLHSTVNKKVLGKMKTSV